MVLRAGVVLIAQPAPRAWPRGGGKALRRRVRRGMRLGRPPSRRRADRWPAIAWIRERLGDVVGDVVDYHALHFGELLCRHRDFGPSQAEGDAASASDVSPYEDCTRDPRTPSSPALHHGRARSTTSPPALNEGIPYFRYRTLRASRARVEIVEVPRCQTFGQQNLPTRILRQSRLGAVLGWQRPAAAPALSPAQMAVSPPAPALRRRTSRPVNADARAPSSSEHPWTPTQHCRSARDRTRSRAGNKSASASWGAQVHSSSSRDHGAAYRARDGRPPGHLVSSSEQRCQITIRRPVCRRLLPAHSISITHLVGLPFVIAAPRPLSHRRSPCSDRRLPSRRIQRSVSPTHVSTTQRADHV